MTTHNVGDVLSGGYRIIDIKRGGMGVVYICHQPPDRFYAVKTVNATAGGAYDSHAEDQFFKYFRDEVDLWIRVSRESRHENIVEALLYNEHEHWLFLEYVNGLSVSEAALGGPLHMKHAADWAMGIARGMAVMHSEFSLIHRDLKPQNVLVSKKGLVPKISDLGIAKVLQEDTGENTIIGTKGYRAPETWAGKTDFCSDIYSFGALLNYMLTGSPPKGKESPFDPVIKIPPPSDLNARVPEALDALTLRCLEDRPENRFQSFAEIIEVLESLEPLEGAEFNAGFEHCAEHKFYSPRRDDRTGCLFCNQTTQHDEQLERALTVMEATVHVQDAPGLEQTSRVPTDVRRRAGAVVTATAPSREASATSTAPWRTATGPTRTGEEDDDHHRPWLLASIGGALLVLAAVVSYLVFGGEKDPGRHETPPFNGNGKNGPEVDPASLKRAGQLVTCGDQDCGRTFTLDTFHWDRNEITQKYCEDPKHVTCGQCGYRHINRHLWSSCPYCLFTKYK